MLLFKNWLSSKKDESTRRRIPRPARSTIRTAPKYISAPLSNSSLSRSISSPLANGDSSRPRTAGSTRTANANSPRSMKTGRPVTSQAALPTCAHREVEAPYVSSEAASKYPPQSNSLTHSPYPANRTVPKSDSVALRYSNPKNQRSQFEEKGQQSAAGTSVLPTQGQPKEPSRPPIPSRAKHSPPTYMVTSNTGSSAYPPKPEHLDDRFHPAYRAVPESDKSALQYTNHKVEHLSLCRSPHSDQLQSQFKHRGQRGVAETSVLRTQGRKPKELSRPPLPSQAKSSPSSRIVSSGTSSSASRDQQSRRCTDNSRPREPAAPPLLSRTQRSELSRTTPVDTSGSLDLRQSCASTIFSDVEGENAITTEPGYSELIRLGRTFGLRPSEISWKPGPRALDLADKCIEKLSKIPEQMITVDAVALLQICILAENATVEEYANKAWLLLSPDSPKLRIRHITKRFCQYFFYLHFELEGNVILPDQVPVDIRAQIHPYYENSWKKIEEVNGNNYALTRWIDNLEGEGQGLSLIALFEIKMHTSGPLECSDLLSDLLKLTQQVTSLRHASEDQVSNFFATYVRAFRIYLRETPSGPNEDKLAAALHFFKKFWALCTAQYNNQITGNYPSLFTATIKKLPNIDIPLCLWIFLAGSGTGLTQNMQDPTVKQMYLAMESELNFRVPNELPEVLPVFMTVQFLLSVRYVGFFDIMHLLMQSQHKLELWRCVWITCQRLELYAALSQYSVANLEFFIALLSH